MKTNHLNGCRAADCDRPFHSNGLCKLHNQRLSLTGRLEVPTETVRPHPTPRPPLGDFTALPRELCVAWAAGFLDGEGCIRICIHSIRVVIPQVDPAPLRVLHALFGGSIRLHSKADAGRQIYVFEVGSRDAEAALREMRPFLFSKHEQADLALEFMASIKRPQGRMAPEERERRSRIIAEVKALKWREYAPP